MGNSKLALFGGEKAVNAVKKDVPADLFKWPVITEEDEAAILEVLRRGAMSDTDVTIKFENEFAAWIGTKYALGHSSGTMSVETAMFACGVGYGDEIICPSKTYWASALQVFNLGATVVFADIDPDTVCIDPKDIERCISSDTKAIIAVHYLSRPCDMDAIMEIAKKHDIKVIEDVSHAQGGYYKGKKLGTIGHCAAMSLMSGKSFPTGEMGMLVTDDKEIYDRAVAYSHHNRNNAGTVSTANLTRYYDIPMGGIKGRVNQTCAAMGRVQLKHYDERIGEIDKAMNYFWDSIEGYPGIKSTRPPKSEGSTMAGWYVSHGVYHPEQLSGLSVEKFCEAIRAEGAPGYPGGNFPLHKHPAFIDMDVLGVGKPARIAFAHRDVRELDKALPVTENIKIIQSPWFKKFYPEYIDLYVNAYKKVIENYEELLVVDENADKSLGRMFFHNSKTV
jgi:dTDP-4-amino-4,6-dideoxygalactose transaminase